MSYRQLAKAVLLAAGTLLVCVHCPAQESPIYTRWENFTRKQAGHGVTKESFREKAARQSLDAAPSASHSPNEVL